MEDESLRVACFASLDVLCATHGDDIPYPRGLDQGFPFQGRRVPFLSRYKGIYRAALQEGPAALSITTSHASPYDDEEIPDGFLYAFRAGAVDQPDNRALRYAYALQTPVVYFIATRPNWYRPLYPCYLVEEDVAARHVLVAPGRVTGPMDERDFELPEDPLDRRYGVREARMRLHQARFRGRVLVAYASRCAICRLKETRLLDAAHIVADVEERGEPAVSNGLSLCSIHHRAFDQDLVGVAPNYTVHVSQRLLIEEDGPMLDLLKGFHRQLIEVPSKKTWKPNQDALASRFERFSAAPD